MREALEKLLHRLHHSQSGAVALLAMAALLIVFLTAMTMYDAGEGARDKMDVQIGADTAALSHAAVKARAMNMVAYSNITKRILYGYNTIYVAAFLALVEATGYYLFEAGKHAGEAIATVEWCLTIIGCAYPISEAVKAIDNAITAVKGIIQLILELIEFGAVTGERLFGLPIPGSGEQWRSAKEVSALDLYQEYISKMSPWWGWGEGVTRGMRNGSTLVGTYPIPNGDAARLRDKIRFGINVVSSVLGTAGADELVKTTNNKDELPIEQIPEFVKLTPFFSAVGIPKWIAHSKLCAGTLTSLEFWGMQYFFDHWRPSEGYWDDDRKPWGAFIAPKYLVTGLEIAQMPLGCVVSALTLGHEVLPYDLKAEVQSPPWAVFGNSTPENWLKATMNVSLGYRRGQGRFDNTARRSKMSFLRDDYSLGANEAFFRNDGYWALSKAEIIYEAGIIGAIAATFAGIGNVPGLGSILNTLKNWANEPNMWSPRWTARSRPFALPGEADEALNDMDAMYHDMLPFMAITTPLALAYGDGGSFPSLEQITNLQGQAAGAMSFLENFAYDAFFMERAADGFTVSNQQSGWEK